MDNTKLIAEAKEAVEEWSSLWTNFVTPEAPRRLVTELRLALEAAEAERADWKRRAEEAARITIRTEAELTRSALPSKDTLERCLCTAYSQDAGGGYFEPLVEQDPACPVHSEYVFDPQVAAWVHRDSLDAAPERTLTDADLDRFETTAAPIYRSTIEAEKASKFIVSDLAGWVTQLVAELRRLTAAREPATTEARAEAYRRYDGDTTIDETTGEPTSHDDWGYAECQRDAFIAGFEWRPAETQPDPQPRLLADLQEHGYPQETKQEETP